MRGPPTHEAKLTKLKIGTVNFAQPEPYFSNPLSTSDRPTRQNTNKDLEDVNITIDYFISNDICRKLQPIPREYKFF